MPPNTSPQTPAPAASPPADQFGQLADRLSSANNVLVTVAKDPSIDQLAACIGLTIALNKQGKHATAVFSGEVPSIIDFLQPDETLEKNTDSLRDFIVSLDKAKADKLRYKVEDEFVKIFITPYKTSISEDDLTFSQGDFNIDLIIALGVHDKTHLDDAIIAHGRILHDATVACINTEGGSELGSINWVNSNASSLCEMVSDLVIHVGKSLLDQQISTAFLTGMVAETDRFGNEKAQPHTMSVSGVLMAAGASPQLISEKLEPAPADEIPPVVEPEEIPKVEEPAEEEKPEEEAIFEIEHEEEKAPEPAPKPAVPKEENPDDINIDEEGRLRKIAEELEAEAAAAEEGRGLVMDPPQLGGQLTANTVAEHEQYSPSTDPLSAPPSASPLLDRLEENAPDAEFTSHEQTLTDIEKAVGSPHIEANSLKLEEPGQDVPAPPPVDDARSAVDQATLNDSYRPEPINALGAVPVDLNLSSDPVDEPSSEETKSENTPPPPVPPPMMPPSVL